MGCLEGLWPYSLGVVFAHYVVQVTIVQLPHFVDAFLLVARTRLFVSLSVVGCVWGQRNRNGLLVEDVLLPQEGCRSVRRLSCQRC